MSYDLDETSVSESNPIECYRFEYNNKSYCYTSSQYTQVLEGYVYTPEYIERGSSLKLGDSGGTVETCTIDVPRSNTVAMLYQGAPPELSSVRVRVYRLHGSATDDFLTILDGVVSQVRLKDSTAELTITIENVLNRYIPRGVLSYSCQNCIYDEKCCLKSEDYAFRCTVSGWEGLVIQSNELRDKPSGYFTDGYIRMANSVRAIAWHEDNKIGIKYPINEDEKQGSYFAYPGCSQLFKFCHERFNNTDNFNGVPYIQPYSAYNHATTRGTYWVNGNVIVRDSKGVIYTPNL